MRQHGIRLLALAACAVVTVSCGGPSVEITEAVEVTDVKTGWFDDGIQPDGKNRLVPTVGFRLRNMTDESVSNVQLNAVFRQIGVTEEWGSSFMRAIGSDGLEPGVADELVLRSNLGYTSTEPRTVMLTHSQFKDVHVQVFAKHGGAQWTLLGEWDVERLMLME